MFRVKSHWSPSLNLFVGLHCSRAAHRACSVILCFREQWCHTLNASHKSRVRETCVPLTALPLCWWISNFSFLIGQCYTRSAVLKWNGRKDSDILLQHCLNNNLTTVPSHFLHLYKCFYVFCLTSLLCWAFRDIPRKCHLIVISCAHKSSPWLLKCLLTTPHCHQRHWFSRESVSEWETRSLPPSLQQTSGFTLQLSKFIKVNGF